MSNILKKKWFIPLLVVVVVALAAVIFIGLGDNDSGSEIPQGTDTQIGALFTAEGYSSKVNVEEGRGLSKDEVRKFLKDLDLAQEDIDFVIKNFKWAGQAAIQAEHLIKEDSSLTKDECTKALIKYGYSEDEIEAGYELRSLFDYKVEEAE